MTPAANIADATARYEGWLRGHCDLDARELRRKHELMAAADPFPFFRATYYRWATVWPDVCQELQSAPRVLAVGDLHAENFGTWRDADGRLCWGVNDFDEAADLPYPNDLVRLAASARFARESGGPRASLADVCRWLLAGYRACLAEGGRPFVLEEHHRHLRELAMARPRRPAKYWRRTARLRDQPPEPESPWFAEADRILRDELPAGTTDVVVRSRRGIGAGSLGRPRFAAIGLWHGSWVAREAKAVVPPATVWAFGGDPASRAGEAVRWAVRCPDLAYRPGERWVVRRLGPKFSRLVLKDLRRTDDARRLFEAMGAETANVHLGTPPAEEAIAADLDRREDEWLEAAARRMVRAMTADWQAWRAGRSGVAL
jgi:hypothetical protein